jgi:hypothetical protein
MTIETVVEKRIKKLKRLFPEMDEKELERELIPLSGEEIQPEIIKKKVKI